MTIASRVTAAAMLVLSLVVPAAGASAQDATVSITDGLEPDQLTIVAGASVTWVNDDDERHRMRSRDGAAEFDSGNLEPGERFTFTFEVPGEHRYVDERDPDDVSYHGTVTVTPGGSASGGTPSTDGTPQDGPEASSGTGTGVAAEPAVSILDRSFSPRDVTVSPGTDVTWANRSDREHTVTFQGGGGSGELGAGATFTRSFDSPGTYDYLCALHPEMTGTVTVTGTGGAGSVSPEAEPDETDGSGSGTGTPPPTASGTGAGPNATTGPRAVRIVDLAFEPQRLSITTGSLVTWDNAGVAPHTVTSDGFDSGNIPSGGRFSRRFDEPGTYRYRCTLHPQMTGEVLVRAAGTDVTAPGPTGQSDATGAASESVPPPATAGGAGVALPSTSTPSSRSVGGILGLVASFLLGLTIGFATPGVIRRAS